MVRISQWLATLTIILGLVGLALGATFVVQGIDKSNWIRQAMQIEKVTLGIEQSAVARGEVIDTAQEAQVAGDTLREHRRAIAPTYQALGRYDPTNPTHLTYSQALNMENYLYLAVLSFGVIDIAMASGAFMIIMGIAMVATGVALFGLARRGAFARTA